MQEYAVFGKKLDSRRVFVGNKDHSIPTDRQEPWRMELPRLRPFLTKRILVFSIGGKHLDASIVTIGHIKHALRADRDPVRIRKLAVADAMSADALHKFAFRR